MLKKVFPFYDGNLMKMIICIPLPCQPSKTRWLVGEPGRERCLPACNSPTLVSSLLRTSLLTHSPLPPTQTPHQPVDPLPPSADPDSRIARRQQAFCSWLPRRKQWPSECGILTLLISCPHKLSFDFQLNSTVLIFNSTQQFWFYYFQHDKKT